MPAKKLETSSASASEHKSTKPKAAQAEVRIVDLPHEKSQGFVSIYTNTAGLAMNFYDVTILFGRVVNRDNPTESYIEDGASVTMAWEHAKALADSILKFLDIYEHKN